MPTPRFCLRHLPGVEKRRLCLSPALKPAAGFSLFFHRGASLKTRSTGAKTISVARLKEIRSLTRWWLTPVRKPYAPFFTMGSGESAARATSTMAMSSSRHLISSSTGFSDLANLRSRISTRSASITVNSGICSALTNRTPTTESRSSTLNVSSRHSTKSTSIWL